MQKIRIFQFYFQSVGNSVYEDSTLGMEAALHARDRVGVQDFVLLEDYKNIEAFNDNLRKRFSENLIYVSSIKHLFINR